MTTPLRTLRLARGQSIPHVARAVGVVASTLSRMERGLQRPSPELAEKLAKHFGYAITEMQLLYPERFKTVEG